MARLRISNFEENPSKARADPLLQAFRSIRDQVSIGRLAIYLGVAALLLLGGTFEDITFLPALSPDAGNALGLLWQVHTAFVSIGFAGLAIASQVFALPPLAAGAARAAVLDSLQFRLLVSAGGLSNLLIGICAIWLVSDLNVVLAFVFVFAPSVLLMGLAYLQLGHLFENPQEVERQGRQRLAAEVTKALDAQHRKDLENEALRQRLLALPGVVAEMPASEDRIQTVRHEGPEQFVGDLSRERIANAINHANSGNSAQVPPSGRSKDQSAKELPMSVVRVHAVPGQRLRNRSVLFEVSTDLTDRDPRLRTALDMLQESVTFEPDDFVHPEHLLTNEIGALQDSLSEAVHQGLLHRAKTGYHYFEDAVSVGWQDFARSKGSITDTSGLRRGWLVRSLAEADDVAAQGGTKFANAAIDAAYSRCASAVDRGDLDYFVSGLQTYRRVWERLIAQECALDLDARNHLLNSLHTLASLRIGMHLNENSRYPRAASECVWVFVNLVRAASDRGSSETALRSLNYLDKAFPPPFADDDIRAEVRSGALVLLGWLIYHAESGEKFDLNLAKAALKMASGGGDVEVAFRLATSTDLRHSRWEFWEFEGAMPFEVMASQFSAHVRMAASLAMAVRPPVLEPVDTDDQERRWEIQALQQDLDSIPERWIDQFGLKRKVGNLLKRVDRVLEEYKEALDASVAEAEIDHGKRVRFENALGAALSEDRLIRRFTRAETVPEGASETLIGFNLSVPKSYFVATAVGPDPDPAHVADRIGKLTEQAESKFVLSQLKPGRGSTSALDHLTAHLKSITAEMIRPLAIVPAFGQIANRLKGITDFPGDETPDPIGGLDLFESIDLADDEDGGEQRVIIVDLEDGPWCTIESESKVGMEAVGTSGVSLSIHPGTTGDEVPSEPRVIVETGQVVRWVTVKSAVVYSVEVTGADW